MLTLEVLPAHAREILRESGRDPSRRAWTPSNQLKVRRRSPEQARLTDPVEDLFRLRLNVSEELDSGRAAPNDRDALSLGLESLGPARRVAEVPFERAEALYRRPLPRVEDTFTEP